MAKLIGDLVPEDDYMHELGPEPNFNESMYFNFFDPEKSIGGFVRLGNRANEGQAEMTVTLYLPDGRVLFMFKRPDIDGNDAFDAGGLRFEVIELSFLDVPDPEERAYLNKQSTSLALSDEAVDRLRTAARQALRGSSRFQDLLGRLQDPSVVEGDAPAPVALPER